MTKEFKTTRELLDIMLSRGIELDTQTEILLSREGYYPIINGYKDPFLDRKAMVASSDDVYLPGTKFEWIYSLFCFDRDLRHLSFKHLAAAESIMKNAIVQAFCEKHPELEGYLDEANYVDASSMLTPKGFKGNKGRIHGRNLAEILRILNGKLHYKHPRPFISHYLKNHKSVPLWVLSKDLTFGNIAHFYQLQERSIQNKACKLISKANESQRRITPLQLLHAFSVLVDFRNLCAHGERLYCTRTGKSGDIGFSEMTTCLQLILPEEEHGEFFYDVEILLNKYERTIRVARIDALFRSMGFRIK